MKEINKDMMYLISGAGSEQSVKPVEDFAPAFSGGAGNWGHWPGIFIPKNPMPPTNNK
ncbi:hypothetical protein [Xenorhabdus sp. KJ12.1]|uniref:hypothetical protein n=1 Tax=Xenorhabdus sp. KJ12.1 TaxID=1851571 RepID=UPI000C063A2D|nr:hypothetical protein [Xenorhabdus sp. KJ12.1]PHM66591.1 hypothetical protein Xekj_04092 [Xenorhabdus sp. KJ12.1]